jgi:hypothetical protein
MKHFNLYMRSGSPEISEPFATEGEAIMDARSFHFSNDPASDWVYHLWFDHNGEPCVSEYTTDDIEGEDGFDTEELV